MPCAYIIVCMSGKISNFAHRLFFWVHLEPNLDVVLIAVRLAAPVVSESAAETNVF